jgi:DNA-binding PadR family transcriptional regulator
VSQERALVLTVKDASDAPSAYDIYDAHPECGTQQTVYGTLSQLCKEKVLDRIMEEGAGKDGRPAYVYKLGPKAEEYLRGNGEIEKIKEEPRNNSKAVAMLQKSAPVPVVPIKAPTAKTALLPASSVKPALKRSAKTPTAKVIEGVEEKFRCALWSDGSLTFSVPGYGDILLKKEWVEIMDKYFADMWGG